MKRTQLLKQALLSSMVLAMMNTHASTVRNDINYQYFRDFAENKGKFIIGASNIDIYDARGNKVGVMLQGVAMPDFSSTNSKTGTHTLIDPQYVVSVAHNKPSLGESDSDFHLYTHQFGGQTYSPDNHRYTYAMVDVNSHESHVDEHGNLVTHFDYQTPRLAKLVTEVAPAITTKANLLPNTDDSEAGRQARFKNFKDIFSYFVRLGSGTQNVIGENQSLQSDNFSYPYDCSNANNCELVSGAYRYLTGSSPIQLYEVSDKGVLRMGGHHKDGVNFVYDKDIPMTALTTKGDSGSPMFAFNKNTNQWELISVLQGLEWIVGGSNPMTIATCAHQKRF